MADATPGGPGAVTGVISRVQRYSIHDGPGIRTTVFLSGCPLRCIWCQNPETLTGRPEVLFEPERCTGCGRCIQVCPEACIELVDGRARTSREGCSGCGQCADACPSEARWRVGGQATAAAIFEKVMEDALFYAGSGGGVTLSGGDPLAQAGFSRSLLRLCRERGIHTAIETSCYGPWRTVSSVLEYTDLMLFDLKHMDSRQHQRLTGVPNEPILENVKRARRELSLSMCARIPIIPGINDSEANLAASAEFVAGLGGVEVHLLPYNPLGETKRHQLEMTTQMFSVEAPDARRMAELQRLVESHGLVVHIGG